MTDKPQLLNPEPAATKDHLAEINMALTIAGVFTAPDGAYGLVDGQFGSTGKGLACSLLATLYPHKVDFVTSNAGPNSGHTSYYKDKKIVLKQLPTFPVIARLQGHEVETILNAGAIISPKDLYLEQMTWGIKDHLLTVHPNAAVIDDDDLNADLATNRAIGSTGKGVGPALIEKIRRLDPTAVAGGSTKIADRLVSTKRPKGRVLVEVSQGFSLGINSGMYPFVTSRECTIGQALSDAGIHPSFLRETMMVVRTFPIRVAGNSGPGYPDQEELSWEELGQVPELTTVTQKVRRVFTWSTLQYMDAIRANRPGIVFLNFCNYLPTGEVPQFVQQKIIEPYERIMGKTPCVLLGFGPTVEEIRLWKL